MTAAKLRGLVQSTVADLHARSMHRFVGNLEGSPQTSTLLSTDIERALSQAHTLESVLRDTALQQGVGYYCAVFVGPRRIWSVSMTAKVVR